MSKARQRTGTREWSARSVNCCDGCSHGCLYCYGREAAARGDHRPEDWTTESVRPKAVHMAYGFSRGTVMFPTIHDITPTNLEACLIVLGKLLAAGNRVLIVSKPHPMCVGRICQQFRLWSAQILFRFTIGCLSREIAEFWEPGAPPIADRLACLCGAFAQGFETSVSCEPLLEPERVGALVATVDPFVSETIWIGKANHLRRRTAWCRQGVPPGLSVDLLHAEIGRIGRGQSDERVREIYELLKDNPKIRWKDSYRQVLGLPAQPRTQ